LWRYGEGWTLAVLPVLGAGWAIAAAVDHPVALLHPADFRDGLVSSVLVDGIIVTGALSAAAGVRTGRDAN
jgi:hypothetical protein